MSQLETSKKIDASNLWRWNFVEVNGRKIHWGVNNFELLDSKEKPVLFYVHGIASKADHWLQVATCLQSRYCTILINRPGYGRSEEVSFSSLEDAAWHMKNFLNVLKINRPIVLVGHSLGGTIGLYCAARYPETFNALVLVASFVRFKVHFDTRNQMSGNFESEEIRSGFSRHTSDAIIKQFEEDVLTSNPGAIRTDFTICDGCDIRDKLGAVLLPVLVMAPTEDKVVSQRQVEYLRNGLSGVRVSYISEAGHNVLLEQPQKVAKAIDLFLKDMK